MRVWRWVIVSAPGVVGILVAWYLFQAYDPVNDHIVYLRSDIGTLVLIGGVALSGLAALGIFLFQRQEDIRREAAETANDERRRFLRRLDHELKNPLTAIRAGLVNLADSSDGEARKAALLSVESQTLRLSRLSADLRKLAELEVRLVEHSAVDTSAFLRDAFNMAQEQPAAAERTLSLSIPSAPWPLPNIQGDSDLLFLAVHNLLENALKFSKQGDTIELRAFEDGPEIVIEVADTGPGIPKEEQPHVWEDLYRGESAQSVPGSGLGLALVRAIVERHNGRVSLRSRLGQGTVFALHLPIACAPRSAVTIRLHPVPGP